MKRASVLILAVVLLLSLAACQGKVDLAQDELSEIAQKYPAELEYMEQELDCDLSSIDEETFRKMQEVATYNMGSRPDLDLSGLITDLSVLRFNKGH